MTDVSERVAMDVAYYQERLEKVEAEADHIRKIIASLKALMPVSVAENRGESSQTARVHSFRGRTLREAMVQTLKDAGKPLTLQQMAEVVVAGGYDRGTSDMAKLRRAMSAVLSKDVALKTGATFKRTGNYGEYELTESGEA